MPSRPPGLASAFLYLAMPSRSGSRPRSARYAAATVSFLMEPFFACFFMASTCLSYARFQFVKPGKRIAQYWYIPGIREVRRAQPVKGLAVLSTAHPLEEFVPVRRNVLPLV